ncbi:MAG TPA: glycoside hydrolase family 38 C-terminal domain-containing protein [Ktedonobacteraceae bacterium]
MAEQLNIIIVPHTHWDREWYQTFQQFRIRLVKTIDRLLEILDRDEGFRYFMLDGQTIVLDDYLEIQPEQEERLKHYTRAGRILVGPWYLQPDEFLVSGESLIRNLQIGLRRAAEFGSTMHVGYVPDCFGHIAQLPQILQGVGIDNAVFWRGVGAEATTSEFYWTAPDGTKVLVIHLADPVGYSNARFLPLNPEEFVARVELLASNILPQATTNNLLFMNGSDHLEPQNGLPAVIAQANGLLAHIDPEHAKILTRSANGTAQQHSNGHTKDYTSIVVRIGTLPEYIECVRQQNTQFPTLTGEMRSSQYAHLLPSVLSTRMWIKQQNTATEHLLERIVEPLTAWATTLGAPYPQGLIRAAWKYLLQNHPHDSICGCSIDQVHRENSVRFAQSQQIGEGIITQALQQIAAEVDTRAPFAAPHMTSEPVPIVVFNPAPGPRTASVQTTVQLPGSLYNAVIVDEQGAHMPYHVINRWRQEIGSMPIAREMLATALALSGISSPAQLVQMAETMIMTALNQSSETHAISRVYIENYSVSSPHHEHYVAQAGVVHIEIMIAPRGRIAINEHEIDQAFQQVMSLLEREELHTLQLTLIDQARETIDFVAADLPAYGLKTFWLYPRGLKEEGSVQQHNSIVPLVAQAQIIENEFYRVEVNVQDGTLIVTDKLTNVVFSGLNRFIDGGDVGDLYTYCPPEYDTLISTPVEPPKVELINSGPVKATLRISGRWSLPGACAASRTERSARSIICPIVSEISLTPGIRRIDIHTSVENKAKDHRLRVAFPIPYTVDRVAAEGTFEVRTRPVAQPVPPDVTEWAEAPVNVFPQKRFVDVSNDEIGLGILNRGLPEYEVIHIDHRPDRGADAIPGQGGQAVAITLLRCIEWLSRGDLSTRHGHAGPMEYTPEAQCLGLYEFDYALVPHRGTWESENGLVIREAQIFNTPVTTRTVGVEQHNGKLPSQMSFIVVEPDELVLSALKHSEEGIIVRIYNPLARSVDATIMPGFAFIQVYMANLLEEYLEEESSLLTIDQATGSVRVSIRGGGIMTLLFTEASKSDIRDRR